MSYSTKYGEYSSTQIHNTKLNLQKSIFFLLLYKDPKESNKYKNVDIPAAFRGIQHRLIGLNSILLESPEIVETMSLLEAALIELQSECYDWHEYRKLILDAGSAVMRIKEGD